MNTDDLFLNKIHLIKLAGHYNINCDCLDSEITLVKKLLCREENKNIKSLMEFLSFVEQYKQAFECIYNLVKICILIPISTASCERSFSSMKRIKSYLRTRMTNERLNNISILSVEKDISKLIDFNDVVEKFASLNKIRRIKLV